MVKRKQSAMLKTFVSLQKDLLMFSAKLGRREVVEFV
jgi:hypothetical protein